MDKHFEPVTARSLASDLYERAIAVYQSGVDFDRGMNILARIIEPHIRKPSDDDKSVPARCEEAYDEAMELIKGFAGEFTHEVFMSLRGKADKLIKKPNPFKEADIVKEDETEPTLLPFSLEDAKNGAKVVTTKGDDVKIVADDLTGNFPLLAVVTTAGVKVSRRYSIDGSTEGQHPPMDLFILKEPETIEIRIFRGENHELHFTASKVIANEDYWTYIKTIKTTI